VEFDSPIYKAPSLPKISRRNISSPIIRGAQSVAAPRLRKSSFSFIKPRIQTPTLTSQVETSSESETISGNKVYETLVETNKILVEIQKQLALDFASRIVERKDIIRGKKRKAEKEKITRKEQSIESLNKFGSGVGNFFDKVTAPAKSIFQKLLDFFGIIVTGLVVNNAFNWLSDKNNQKKLSETLGFVGKYWKEIFGVLIGLQLVSTIASLLTAIQLVSAVLLSSAFLNAAGIVAAIAAQNYINQKEKEIFNKASEKEAARRGIKKEEVIQEYERTRNNPFLKFIRDVAEAQQAGGAGPLVPTTRSKGGTIPNLSSYNFKTSIVKQYQNITQKFSEGGTVGGAGSGLVDSVRTMLAPGEEVIRTSAAMMFRPLLKDINNNAGRMWITFSNAIRNMISYNETMRYALDELSRNLETFKKQLDDFVNQEKLEKSKKAGGGGYGLRTPSKDSITTLVLPTTIIHSDLKKPTRPATRTTIPITLPTKTANYKMPAIDGGMATDEPDISSVNLANDYMMLTPRMYGIFV
jgi:hypothetical protein